MGSFGFKETAFSDGKTFGWKTLHQSYLMHIIFKRSQSAHSQEDPQGSFKYAHGYKGMAPGPHVLVVSSAKGSWDKGLHLQLQRLQPAKC